MSINVLHLSDLHISAFDDNNVVVAQKIAYIKTHYPDHHYLITGDLIDNEGHLLPGATVPVHKDDPNLWNSIFASPPPPFGPLQPHLDIARQGMHKAFELVSQLPLERVYICPGNHDMALWGNVYAVEFANAFDEILWRPINGSKAVTQLGVLDNPFFLPHVNSRVPIMFSISEGGSTVQLILLNTNPDSSTATILELASGRVGGGQLDKLRTFVTADLLFPGDPAQLRRQLGLVRLVAFHHHPWFNHWAHQIDDATDLMAVLRRTTDLVCFGHRHVQHQYGPSTWEAAQIQHGGLASGWIRSEATAAQISVTTGATVNISYVPLA